MQIEEATTIDQYLELPYTIEVRKDQGAGFSGWFARVVELPGCMTQAESFSELDKMVEEAIRLWIEAALESELPIPTPLDNAGYSGKFIVRVPKSLHRELIEMAEREGASMNALVNMALAKLVSGSNVSRPLTSSRRYRSRGDYASYRIAEGESGLDEETE